jgi:cysteine desulfurase
MNHVYLDFAAATPIDPSVWAEYERVSFESFANPSSTHFYGRASKDYLENARITAATFLHAKPQEIIFTASATESNNLAIQGILRAFQNQNSAQSAKPHILVSEIEHASVIEAQQFYTKDCEVETFQVNTLGLADLDDLFSKIKPETCLISLMLVNNEIGTIQPIQELSARLSSINSQRKIQGLPIIYLHTDAAQAPNYIPVDVSDLGVDLLTLSSQKVYAPRGAALLYVKTDIPLEPITFGGNQEKSLRSGTQNTAAIWAFAQALKLSETMREKDKARTIELITYLKGRIFTLSSQIMINGLWDESFTQRIPNNLSLHLPGLNQESLLTYLDLNGICVSSGSSCQSGANEQSHVIKHIQNLPGATLRISIGRTTTRIELDYFVEILSRALVLAKI